MRVLAFICSLAIGLSLAEEFVPNATMLMPRKDSPPLGDPLAPICLAAKNYLPSNRNTACHIRAQDCPRAIDFVCNRVSWDRINQPGTTDLLDGTYSGVFGKCAANAHMPRGGYVDYATCVTRFNSITGACVKPQDKSNGNGTLDNNEQGGGTVNWSDDGKQNLRLIDQSQPVFQLADPECLLIMFPGTYFYDVDAPS
ncbi:MAG: hypothetical protein M1825_001569 [Sarcosagium campestre]|nr:MAG: hypothetical protein M1825_001569 [Sarcosagium campestre]